LFTRDAASLSLLGTSPDSKIAKILGVATNAVTKRRESLLIPSFRE
jgi:hypothetical protein